MFRYLTTSIQAMHRNPKDGHLVDVLIRTEFETISELHDSCGEFALTVEETEALISKLAQSVHVAKEARDIYGSEKVITVNVDPREAPVDGNTDSTAEEDESPEHSDAE